MKYLLSGEETERLSFRKINNSDFNQWLEFFKDPSAFEHWIAHPEDPETECKKWYQKQRNRYENDLGGMNALIEKESGKLIGHCGLLVQHVDDQQELEIGYSLLRDYRNKGFATEAAIKCRDYAFENNLADSLISIISVTNVPSANVATKNGMKVEKQTMYNNNPVNIFRIKRGEWKQL